MKTSRQSEQDWTDKKQSHTYIHQQQMHQHNTQQNDKHTAIHYNEQHLTATSPSMIKHSTKMLRLTRKTTKTPHYHLAGTSMSRATLCWTEFRTNGRRRGPTPSASTTYHDTQHSHLNQMTVQSHSTIPHHQNEQAKQQTLHTMTIGARTTTPTSTFQKHGQAALSSISNQHTESWHKNTSTVPARATTATSRRRRRILQT